jgi:hypothetical protein
MSDKADIKLFKSGLWLCWMSILAAPVGLLAIGGGPCAEPNNAAGSIILLTAGVCALSGTIFGMNKVGRSLRAEDNPLRWFGLLSMFGAILSGLAGALYLFIGVASAAVFFKLS